MHVFVNGHLSGNEAYSQYSYLSMNLDTNCCNVSELQCSILKLTGSAFGTGQYKRFTFTGGISLHAGINRISLLSVAVGLQVSMIKLRPVVAAAFLMVLIMFLFLVL